MSQCVPSWELEENSSSHHNMPLHHHPSTTIHAPTSYYRVAELTWENGHLAMHGYGAPHRVAKPVPKYPSSQGASPWEKPGRASGTLESVVDQGTRALNPAAAAPQSPHPTTGCDHVHWVGPQQSHNDNNRIGASAVPAVVDALVPCSNLRPHGAGDDYPSRDVPDSTAGLGGGGGTCVASCSGRKRARPRDGNCSATGSVASMALTLDTCEVNGSGDETGFTASASPVDTSPETENTSGGRPLTVTEDHDSVCHSRQSKRDDCEEEEKTKGGEKGRSSISINKRSRAAAVHNQSERKRRDRINQRMKTLQKLVPNSSKTDKASMLDEVIEYLKQLQAHVQMMSRMNSIPHMMMPMTMQQLQMAMMAQMAQMAQMGMGIGMGMGMVDMNSLGRPGHSGMPPVLHPSAFLPLAGSWDGPGVDRLPAPGGAAVLPDPFAAAFMPCQTQQPMNMDAYTRMAAALYQQLYQPPPGGGSNTPKTT